MNNRSDSESRKGNLEGDRGRGKTKRNGGMLSIIFVVLCVFTLAVLILRIWFFAPVKIEGDSMNDTLITGEKYFIHKTKNVQRGDIIVFNLKGNKEDVYIKRLVAIEGDTVSVENDTLYVNGDKKEESYLKEQKRALDDGEVLTADIKEVTLEDGMYYVLGDNRMNSADSRDFGAISKEDIIGKLLKKE